MNTTVIEPKMYMNSPLVISYNVGIFIGNPREPPMQEFLTKYFMEKFIKCSFLECKWNISVIKDEK